MTLTLMQERVQAGIKFLDENAPRNWRERVDLDRLDIDKSSRCMLGQIYNNYWTGLTALNITTPQAVDLGFIAGNTSGALLTQVWREQIAATPRPAEPEPVRMTITLTRELLELFTNRQAEIDDPDHSLWSTEFVVDGVRIRLDADA
jgi:hypothetical protein